MDCLEWIQYNCKFARLTVLQKWIESNCRFASFNAPKQGDRISIAGKPDPYFLVINPPQRFREGWTVRLKGQDGLDQFFNDSEIPSWSHFKGQKYPWDEEDARKKAWEKQQKEQKDAISAFENKYKFRDGQPLRKNPARPMIVSVLQGAPGNLGAFEGERGAKLHVLDVDYANETVKLSPIGEGLADLAPYLEAVPAADVVKGTVPVMNPAVMSKIVDLRKAPLGRQVTAEELMHLTPGLNRLAINGQVTLKAQIFGNHKSRRGNGLEIFREDIENRSSVINLDWDRLPSERQVDGNGNEYRVNWTEKGEIFGAWSADVIIAPPVPKDVKDEIANVAPRSVIRERRDGSVLVYSKPLYEQMVSLGVLDAPVTSPISTRAPQPVAIPGVAVPMPAPATTVPA